MKHRLICGATGNGKTWFAKNAIKKVAAYSDAEILIFSPVDFDGWAKKAKIYSDIEQFVAAIESYIASGKRACHIYIDEFGFIKTHYRDFSRYPAVLKQLTTMSRHYGITAWIAAQRPTQVHPDIRNNCAETICFYLVGEADRKAIHDLSAVKRYDSLPLWQSIAQLKKKEAFVIKPSDRILAKKKIG